MSSTDPLWFREWDLLTHQTVPNQKCQSNERETLCTEAQIPSKMGLVRQDPRAQRAEGKFTQFVSYPWKTGRILMRMLLEMYLSTKKSPLNSRSHQDPDSGSGRIYLSGGLCSLECSCLKGKTKTTRTVRTTRQLEQVQTVYVAVRFWHHFNSALRFEPPSCFAKDANGSTDLATWPPTVTRYGDCLSLFSATSLRNSTIIMTVFNHFSN